MKLGACEMMRTYITALLLFVAIDAPWIYYVVLPSYQAEFSTLLTFRWQPAVIFYVTFIAGLVFFCLRSSKQDSPWLAAPCYGLVTYGTYALTLQACFSFYPWWLAIADWLWGPVLCLLVTAGVRWFDGFRSLSKVS